MEQSDKDALAAAFGDVFSYRFNETIDGVRVFVMPSGSVGMERRNETFMLSPADWFERVAAWTAEHMSAVSLPNQAEAHLTLLEETRDDEAARAVFRLFHDFKITASEADSITRPITQLCDDLSRARVEIDELRDTLEKQAGDIARMRAAFRAIWELTTNPAIRGLCRGWINEDR